MNNSRLSQTFLRMIGTVIVLNSCSQNQVAQTGLPTSPPQEQIKPSLQDEWMPKQVPGTRRYIIEDSSTILLSDDSTHTSSLQTATVYSLSLIALADSFLFTAKVDSMSSNSRSSPKESEANKASAQTVHATFSSTGEMSALKGEAPSSCQGGVDAAAMRVFELTQSYPKKRIRVGDRWTDTVSATSCRGRTVLNQQIIREYQLLELTSWKDHDVAKIQQEVSAIVTATNSESQNNLTATGSGTGKRIFYADRITGFLRESNGRSESRLTINTSRGSYPFTQSITTHIEIR
jgi:hypothetical protein